MHEGMKAGHVATSPRFSGRGQLWITSQTFFEPLGQKTSLFSFSFSSQPNCVLGNKVKYVPICSLTHHLKAAVEVLLKHRSAVKDLASFPASLP